MKILKYLFACIIWAHFTSCSGDEASVDGPVISFIAQSPHISSDAELGPSTPFTVKVRGESNTDIKAITFKLNSGNISSSDITIDGEIAESNPYFIPYRTNDIEFTIGLISSDSPGIYTYNVSITDVDNVVGSKDLTITVN